MNTKHTPGPWSYREDDDGSILIEDGHGEAICVMQKPDLSEDLANARLVAAAPLLEEAIRSVIEGALPTDFEGGDAYLIAASVFDRLRHALKSSAKE